MAAERTTEGAISQINVTPLVDVMLVLLVIFMVTAPILQHGVSVNLPAVAAGPLKGSDVQLVVNVEADGRISLNDAHMSAAELERKLVAVLKERPDREVFLRADREARYGDVVAALAVIKEAGVARLGMVTEPPAELP